MDSSLSLLKLSWKELREAYINKSIKPSQVTAAYLAQMSEYSYLNAYITTCEEIATKAAHESDLRYENGTYRALEGFPIAVKDVFCTKGVRTTAASNVLDNFIPDYESFVTQQLWNAGAIMLGKTNMDEFAMGSATIYSYYGTTFNPWIGTHENPCAIGGSSGGSCASTVAYQSLASLGTDTGGSVRQPAAFGGIVGIRPTYGTCSRRGMIAFSSAHDQAGIFARDVYTAAACLDVIMANDELDSTHARKGIMNLAQISADTVDVTDIRIGILEDLECVADKTILNNIDMVSKLFSTHGSQTEKVNIQYLHHAIATYYVLTPAHAASNLSMYTGTRYGIEGEGTNFVEQCIDVRNKFQDEVKRRILLGNYLLSHHAYDKYYTQALKVQQMMHDEFEELFKTVDVIITPTTPNTAFDLTKKRAPHAMYYEDYYTIVVNMAGLCAISIPVGLNEQNMPVAIQIIAPAFREDLLIKIATFLEKQIQFKGLEPNQIIDKEKIDKYNKL